MRKNSSLCTTLTKLNCLTRHHIISRHCPSRPLTCAGLRRSCRCHHVTSMYIDMVEEMPRQGRLLEGCHRKSAATHLICGLEGVE